MTRPKRKREYDSQPKYLLEFTIPDLPATANAIGRSHWAVRAKNSRKWRDLVVDSVYRRKRPVEALRRACLTLTRNSSVEPDYDNLVHSFKPVIDGLVESQVIANDDPATIGQPHYRWAAAKRNRGFVVVRVEEEAS